MKCVIFAGGKGTRMSTYDDNTPKPLVTIGGKPIIWHIIKCYQYYGISDFIICLGYHQEKFKEYFSNLLLEENDIEISYKNREIKVLRGNNNELNISLIDTGLDTYTGGRLKRVEKYLTDDEFFLTYGDAVSDVDINQLYEYHKRKNKLITVTSIPRKESFGIIQSDDNDNVISFSEKKNIEEKRINAGFMVVNKKVLKYLNENSGPFETEILEKLTAEKEVAAFKFDGFWQCMDYRKEKDLLEGLIHENKAVWMKWDPKYKNN